MAKRLRSVGSVAEQSGMLGFIKTAIGYPKIKSPVRASPKTTLVPSGKSVILKRP
jgi:hypothetical protein